MWILPKNYQLSSRFAPATAVSRSDLKELSDLAAHSLMWRSKPSLARTWSQRWNKGGWIRLLFGRTLKPSQQNHFETALTSFLADTHANLSLTQVAEGGPTTLDTCGRISLDLFVKSDHPFVFLRMLKGTSRWDSPQSSAIWRRWTIMLHQESSQREKSARRTREKGFISWPTSTAADAFTDKLKSSQQKPGSMHSVSLGQAVQMWPTPQNHNYTKPGAGTRKRGGAQVRPRVGGHRDGKSDPDPENIRREREVPEGTPRIFGRVPERCGFWTTEPGVGRVAHGIKNRVDRLRLLGNGVVSQTAEKAARALIQDLRARF